MKSICMSDSTVQAQYARCWDMLLFESQNATSSVHHASRAVAVLSVTCTDTLALIVVRFQRVCDDRCLCSFGCAGCCIVVNAVALGEMLFTLAAHGSTLHISTFNLVCVFVSKMSKRGADRDLNKDNAEDYEDGIDTEVTLRATHSATVYV